MTTVVVTGANRGIGLEFVRQYAKEGAEVISCCRDPKNATALRELATQHKGVRPVPLDFSDFSAIAAFGEDIVLVPMDIHINNAGTYGP
jgi:NAD(P)-dependent dehydrogenase (short-subunit alcohol dehydrogenase family)